MSSPLTINPAHLSDGDWETIRTFLNASRDRGEGVDFLSRVELLTPAEVAKRLTMSRTSVVRRDILSMELRESAPTTDGLLTASAEDRPVLADAVSAKVRSSPIG